MTCNNFINYYIRCEAALETDLRKRLMTLADLPRVLRIEERAYPFPWSPGVFKDCLQVGYQCRVCEQEGRILGYSVHSVAAGEAHLLNLCVDPGVQRQGVGRWLLRQVMEEAHRAGAETLFLEVRLSNRAARKLYESEGFNEVGRRFDYYPANKGREDALVFARTLFGNHDL